MKKFHYFLCKYVFCFSIKNTRKKKTQNKGKKITEFVRTCKLLKNLEQERDSTGEYLCVG